ncbi:MAG: PEGA domain-containing protein [Methanoregula sp.]|nr:PEGA domain-containing protein [Methanoregula sp.]
MNNLYILTFIALLCIAGACILPVTAAPTNCTLSVLSIPDRAAVAVNGTLIGTAPVSALALPCGNNTVTVYAKGYVNETETVNLARGNPQTIIANLQGLPDRGTVIIQSNPEGAELFVDGILRGTTPVVVDALYPGPHSVLLRKDKYVDYRDVVTASAGITINYTEFMDPLPQTGRLSIVSTPDGANVTFDGTSLGTTPVAFMTVAAGNHTIVLRKEGYKEYTQTVSVHGGETVLTQADLNNIPYEGTVIIDSAPSGAEVYLNGTFKSVTPITFEHVPEGAYVIEFRKYNYTPQNITFTLLGGETREIYGVLTNDPANPGTPLFQTYPSVMESAVNSSLPETSAGQFIEKKYQWHSQGQAQSVTLDIPESLYEYYKNQTHTTDIQSLKGYAISDNDRIYLHDLIGKLKESGGNKNLAARNDYRNAVAFVQSIVYADDIDPQTGTPTDYWNYPIETLVEGKGDCEDTAILTAALLKEMDYDVAVVLLPGHAAVAVACDNCNGYYYPIDGKRYYYLETTGTGFSLGSMNFADGVGKYKDTAAQVYVI